MKKIFQLMNAAPQLPVDSVIDELCTMNASGEHGLIGNPKAQGLTHEDL
ncbi:MAG: hypothetical protein GKR94_02175 [Gammaproteobacteria bacterium]|nr:hypothetical protein [Gammaproteobacteria bacterium]